MIYGQIINSPIGFLTLKADDEALLSIDFGKSSEELTSNSITELAAKELSEYFPGNRKEFTVPYKLCGTEFQKKVWQALTEIPYGKTASYEEIAVKIGNPKACRAVGMANNKNKLPVIIPCHRVIGKSGSLTGYAGGIDIKEILLNIERKCQNEAEKSDDYSKGY